MAAKRTTKRDQPRRRGEPGRPSGRPGPDPAEVAQDYIENDSQPEVPSVEPEAADGSDDMQSGTVQDQLVYQNLEANRIRGDLPPAADVKRSRQRERTAPSPRSARAKTRTKAKRPR